MPAVPVVPAMQAAETLSMQNSIEALARWLMSQIGWGVENLPRWLN